MVSAEWRLELQKRASVRKNCIQERPASLFLDGADRQRFGTVIVSSLRCGIRPRTDENFGLSVVLRIRKQGSACQVP